MSVEKTLSIIKPDGVERNLIGSIIKVFEDNHLSVVALEYRHLSLAEAKGFYWVHKNRPFFGELVEYMTRGPVVVMVLEGENAVKKHRELMGATNPKDASRGTIRYLYGKDISENTVHGSDSDENAKKEIRYFFADSIFSARNY